MAGFGLFLLIAISHPVLALSPTVSVTPTVTQLPTVSEDEVRDSLQERLRKAAEEKTSQAKEIIESSKRRAVIGTLKDITSNTISITVKDGSLKQVTLSDQSTIIRNGKSATRSDLVLGDYVIAMGYPAENDVLDGRRIIALDKPTKRIERRIFVGTVSDINAKSRSFSVDIERAIELGGTEHVGISVPKTIDLDISSLKVEQKVVIIAIPDAKDKSSFILKALKAL